MIQPKKDKLEKLCRALQMERTELLAELKQLRCFSYDVEENGEHMFMIVMIHMIRWMTLG